jgi:hypothetical protein
MVGPAIKPSPAQHHVCLQVRMNSYYPTLPSPIPHPKPACSMLFVKKLQRRWKAERCPEEAQNNSLHVRFGTCRHKHTSNNHNRSGDHYWYFLGCCEDGGLQRAQVLGPHILGPSQTKDNMRVMRMSMHLRVYIQCLIRIWNRCMTPVPMHNLTFLTEALTTLDQQCSLHVAKDNSMLSYLYCRVSDGFKIRITGPDYPGLLISFETSCFTLQSPLRSLSLKFTADPICPS